MADPFASKLGLMAYLHKVNCLVKKEKKIIALLWIRSRSQKRFRIPVNVHLNDISSAAEPSVTKLGMVMQHHGPKYHAKRLFPVFKFRVTVRAHLIKEDCFCISQFLSAELLTFCNQIWLVHYHKLEILSKN